MSKRGKGLDIKIATNIFKVSVAILPILSSRRYSFYRLDDKLLDFYLLYAYIVLEMIYGKENSCS